MPRRPNLLFLWTDQQRYDTIGALGNPHIHTPNVDRLVNSATVFDRAYCTQPVCIPSRGSIMTGLWPHTHGAMHNVANLPPHIPCLPELVTSPCAAGYFGKWDLGDEIFPQHGFQTWVSTEDCYPRRYAFHRDQSLRSDYHQFLIEGGHRPAKNNRFTRWETANLPEELGKPAFLATRVGGFLRRHKDDPFIAYVNFLEPHSPCFGPRDDQYDPAGVPLPENFDDVPDESVHLLTQLLVRQFREDGLPINKGGDESDKTPLRRPEDWRRLIAQYWGLCSQVDTSVGEILRTLEQCGLWDNTIIVFTSDHGDMMGSHRLANKEVIYEESIRVPLIVKAAGQRDARRVREPVSQIDLVPTLLELMGETRPSHLQGVSRAAHVRGETDRLTDDVFFEWHGAPAGFYRAVDPVTPTWDYPDYLRELATPAEACRALMDPWRMVVTADGWKFRYSPAGYHELYNLDDDPLERHNLANDPAHRERMRNLTRRIVRWQERVEDPMRYLVRM